MKKFTKIYTVTNYIKTAVELLYKGLLYKGNIFIRENFFGPDERPYNSIFLHLWFMRLYSQRHVTVEQNDLQTKIHKYFIKTNT